MKGLQLLATGGALPNRVVTNEDLRRQVDTSDEWITTRTGICQRYYCTENGYPKHCLPRTGCLGSAGRPACL